MTTTPFVKAVGILASPHKTKQLENLVSKQGTSSHIRHDERLTHPAPKSPDPDSIQSRRDGGGNERLRLSVNCINRVFRTNAALPHTVGLTMLDPFDTQRQSKLPKADQLLRHCT